MNFKVGDKVKILPSATMVGVEEEDIGKVGIISSVGGSGAMVYMDKVCSMRAHRCRWSVDISMIKLFPRKNQQLLFNFME